MVWAPPVSLEECEKLAPEVKRSELAVGVTFELLFKCWHLQHMTSSQSLAFCSLGLLPRGLHTYFHSLQFKSVKEWYLNHLLLHR